MKDLLLHNWHLKLISMGLAAVLWAAVARTPTSEIGVLVSLEYQNIPQNAEVAGDATDRVEVRLRGPSSIMRTVSDEDVSVAIDMKNVTLGEETILPLTPEMVDAPFGAEVVRVIPARVRLTLEPTATKLIRVTPTLNGDPQRGFEIEKTLITPDRIEVEGPASHVMALETVPTTPVNVAGKDRTFKESVELDVPDPIVRVPKGGSVRVEVRIRRQK